MSESISEQNETHSHKHGCGCGCGHDHAPHHVHDENCGCGHDHQGHHHSDAEEIVENTLIVSKKGSVTFEECSADEGLSYIADKIIDIAKKLAIDDAVLGHVKALFACDGGKATISITNIPTPTVIKHDGWDGSVKIHTGELSATILSLVNTDVPAEAMLDALLD